MQLVRHYPFPLTALSLCLACSSPEAVDEGPDGQSGSGGAPAAATDADWTMLAFDPSSNYWNRAEKKISRDNVATLKKVWEVDVGSPPTGTPVITGGRVYVAAMGLYAFDAKTGKQIWVNEDVMSSSSPAYEDGTLYVHDSTGVVRAFDASDGKQRWEYKTDDHKNVNGFSSPVVTKDFIVIGGASFEEGDIGVDDTATFRGFVLALHKDGKLAWKQYTVEEPHNGVGVWSTPSVDEVTGLVYVGTGNNYTGEASDTSDSFLAVPLADGQGFTWKQQIVPGDVFTIATLAGPDSDFGANPILFDIGDQKLVAGGAKGGDFWVLDRTDGTILKSRHLGGASIFKGGVFTSGAWDGKHLIVGCNGATSEAAGSEPVAHDMTDPAVLFALDPLTLDVAWERQLSGTVYGQITIANGVAFVPKDKILEAADLETGEKLFEFPTEGTLGGAAAVSNGLVVFGSGMNWIRATGDTKLIALALPE